VTSSSRALTEPKIANLDLNLLVSLDALLRERSVTRAAERLGLSQPSLSGSLKRLRRYFGDELLVRMGNQYELTPFALELAVKASIALDSVTRVFASENDFDPARAEREFTVLVSDYAIAVLGPHLTRLLSQQAPNMRLNLQLVSTRAVDHAVDTLRTVDGLVLPHGYLADLPSEDLFRDRWVCVVANENELVGDTLTISDLRTLPMVMTWNAPTAYTPAGKLLTMLGVRPRVQIVAETFVAAPFLVAAGNGVALVQERLARILQPATDVRIMECPFQTPPLVEALWWHPMYDHDAGHQWLRSLFAQATELLDPAAP
jgi:DNA-binding transcriptional LysR family regulator